jgi:ribosomal protein S18 acetylase RimI-like enzyme
MPHGELQAGGLTLRRAGNADRAAVEALQRAAYDRNRALLGCEPLPLLADYAQIFTDYEVWVAEQDGIAGALILEPRSGDLLIWSIATDPARQGAGLGKTMLAAAETRARELGLSVMRLYTGATLQHLIDWYGRHGYTVERIEQLSDRAITHMMKRLATS